jgi:hypothetical protein
VVYSVRVISYSVTTSWHTQVHCGYSDGEKDSRVSGVPYGTRVGKKLVQTPAIFRYYLEFHFYHSVAFLHLIWSDKRAALHTFVRSVSVPTT